MSHKKTVTNHSVGSSSRQVDTTLVRNPKVAEAARHLPEEVPIALVFDGGTQAVMMATPADLEDFAIGFALAERIITNVSEITRFEIIPEDNGIEVRLWLAPDPSRQLAVRRRTIAGPTGCGLCGLDSLKAATPPMPKVTGNMHFTAAEIIEAMSALSLEQQLNRKTHAVHAAGFWTKDKGLIAAKEDVGRHNALDKLIGLLHRENTSPDSGMILLTSRVSVELVQKTAIFGAPVIAAISAPTGLALDTAKQCNITLAGIVRADGLEIFTHPHRITEPL